LELGEVGVKFHFWCELQRLVTWCCPALVGLAATGMSESGSKEECQWRSEVRSNNEMFTGAVDL
jgi:hypothetical protein